MTPPKYLSIIAILNSACRGRRPRRPGQHCVTTKLQGGVKTPPYEPTINEHQPIYVITPHTPTGRRGRRPLQPTEKPQQTIEISHRPIVECWPRAAASPSALGFLGARLRSVRAANPSAPKPVPRASEVAGLFCFSFGHKREGIAGATH